MTSSDAPSVAAATSMAATPTPIVSPLEQLEGIELDGGWIVGARIPKGLDQTGGRFSIGYECQLKGGARRAFLKAIDLTEALRAKDLIKALQMLTDAVQCEMELLEVCRRMDRVVTALAFGTLRELVGQILAIPIPYIIFERASGNARSVVKTSLRPSHDWCLMTLHHVATGMRQLHRRSISHSDLKASNVLLFDNAGGAKISDLGRSVWQGRSVWYDSIDWPGDRTYAPPEVAYGFLHSEFNVRRLAADMFLLGSFASVLFCSVPMNTLIFDQLPPDIRPLTLGGTYTGTFGQVLPHLRTAFQIGLERIGNEIPDDAPYRGEILRIIREWCEPDPRERGHPQTRAQFASNGNVYELERYVGTLTNLASHARGYVARRKPL